MPRIELQPQDTIDRDAEQELFSELLQFKEGNEARLLTIKDTADSGKTALMRRLDYNCKYVLAPRKAVCLIEFADEKKAPKVPFELIKQIVTALSSPDFDTFNPLNFGTFAELETLRLTRDFSQFNARSASFKATGVVHLEGGKITGSGARVAGFNVENAQSVTVNAGEWGAEQEDFARQACVNAFFGDLKTLGDHETIILLFDSFDERCDRELKQWILNRLVSLSLNVETRPQKLVVVLAGKELPPFNNPNYSKYVESRNSLSGWSEEHLKAFIKLHGYGDRLIDAGFQYIWAELQKGTPIGRVLKTLSAMYD